ncbi:MAG TPA: zf-HC2 domain-containing protein [Mycobacteriales bacterium]|nr:zf-HC2 domain-containing protein [Mycobacteriales bacterium]
MTCEETVVSLGVYVVGALDPAERAEVDAHLEQCAACRAELASLAGLPELLDRLSIEDFPLELMAAPADLFDRVAARAREEDEQRTRRGLLSTTYRRLTAVAAAAVLVAGASVGAVALAHHDQHPRSSFTATQSGVTMRVTLASQASGTGLNVTVSGLPRDEHCQLIAVGKDGTRDVAGRWDATYSGWAQETGSTRLPRSELAQLILLGNGGTRLATVNV